MCSMDILNHKKQLKKSKDIINLVMEQLFLQLVWDQQELDRRNLIYEQSWIVDIHISIQLLITAMRLRLGKLCKSASNSERRENSFTSQLNLTILIIMMHMEPLRILSKDCSLIMLICIWSIGHRAIIRVHQNLFINFGLIWKIW